MLSLSDNNQTNIIEAFNPTSKYLDDLLNIDNPYLEQMVGQIYPTENSEYDQANFCQIWQILLILKPCFWTWDLSITNDIV